MCIRNSLGDVRSPGLGFLVSAQTLTCIINLERPSGTSPTSPLLFLIVTSGFGGELVWLREDVLLTLLFISGMISSILLSATWFVDL